jgi:hypothetical protein
MNDRATPPAPPTDLSAARIAEVNALHKKFVSSLQKGAKTAFQAGAILREMCGQLPAEVSWPGFVRENFCFTVQTANAYIRVYEGFKDNPGLLEKQTISGALEYLGKPRRDRGRIEYGNPSKQLEFDLETVFAKPPVAKIKLENHRFECPDRRSLWLVRRGLNYPVKFLDLFTNPPEDGLRFPYDAMMKSLQGAVEMYYAEVERIEEKEVLG